MSDTDSFIDEVTEEVQRDKLYGYYRKYGWIALLLVVLAVGGAAFNEYRKASLRNHAEALGDGILDLVEAEVGPERSAGYQELDTGDKGAGTVVDLIKAADALIREDSTAAADALAVIANDPDAERVYREVAAFKLALMQGPEVAVDVRKASFAALAEPGATFRLLAEEQIALIDYEEGEVDAAVVRLQDIVIDAEVTDGLRQRASQLIVLLGGEIDPA